MVINNIFRDGNKIKFMVLLFNPFLSLWREKINVGWIERSETQQYQGLWVLGCAVLNPTYA